MTSRFHFRFHHKIFTFLSVFSTHSQEHEMLFIKVLNIDTGFLFRYLTRRPTADYLPSKLNHL